MKIYIEKEDREIDYELKGEKVLKDVLKELNMSLSSVILVKNGEVCLENSVVTDSDEIKLLSVVSGG